MHLSASSARIRGIVYMLVGAYLRWIDKVSARSRHPHEDGVLGLGHFCADGPGGDAPKRMDGWGEVRCRRQDARQLPGPGTGREAHSRCLGPIDSRPALACGSGPTPMKLRLLRRLSTDKSAEIQFTSRISPVAYQPTPLLVMQHYEYFYHAVADGDSVFSRQVSGLALGAR